MFQAPSSQIKTVETIGELAELMNFDNEIVYSRSKGANDYETNQRFLQDIVSILLAEQQNNEKAAAKDEDEDVGDSKAPSKEEEEEVQALRRSPSGAKDVEAASSPTRASSKMVKKKVKKTASGRSANDTKDGEAAPLTKASPKNPIVVEDKSEGKAEDDDGDDDKDDRDSENETETKGQTERAAFRQYGKETGPSNSDSIWSLSQAETKDDEVRTKQEALTKRTPPAPESNQGDSDESDDDDDDEEEEEEEEAALPSRASSLSMNLAGMNLSPNLLAMLQKASGGQLNLPQVEVQSGPALQRRSSTGTVVKPMVAADGQPVFRQMGTWKPPQRAGLDNSENLLGGNLLGGVIGKPGSWKPPQRTGLDNSSRIF